MRISQGPAQAALVAGNQDPVQEIGLGPPSRPRLATAFRQQGLVLCIVVVACERVNNLAYLASLAINT